MNRLPRCRERENEKEEEDEEGGEEEQEEEEEEEEEEEDDDDDEGEYTTATPNCSRRTVACIGHSKISRIQGTEAIFINSRVIWPPIARKNFWTLSEPDHTTIQAAPCWDSF